MNVRAPTPPVTRAQAVDAIGPEPDAHLLFNVVTFHFAGPSKWTFTSSPTWGPNNDAF
jgi:hypothetical protein